MAILPPTAAPCNPPAADPLAGLPVAERLRLAMEHAADVCRLQRALELEELDRRAADPAGWPPISPAAQLWSAVCATCRSVARACGVQVGLVDYPAPQRHPRLVGHLIEGLCADPAAAEMLAAVLEAARQRLTSPHGPEGVP